jgi:transcriptional regulator with XRE-family HTH domain
MNLSIIKERTAELDITLKELCAKIGMTYQNLNRCINDNKIGANALERISAVLNLPICIFFDDYDEHKCKLDKKVGWEVEKEKVLAEMASQKKEMEFLKREVELKDKIIGLLEAQKVL